MKSLLIAILTFIGLTMFAPQAEARYYRHYNHNYYGNRHVVYRNHYYYPRYYSSHYYPRYYAGYYPRYYGGYYPRYYGGYYPGYYGYYGAGYGGGYCYPHHWFPGVSLVFRF